MINYLFGLKLIVGQEDYQTQDSGESHHQESVTRNEHLTGRVETFLLSDTLFISKSLRNVLEGPKVLARTVLDLLKSHRSRWHTTTNKVRCSLCQAEKPKKWELDCQIKDGANLATRD